MIRTIAVLTLFAVLMITSCAWKDLKPATEVVYEGELIGNETVTYPSAEKVVEICMMTKACMGLSEFNYALPRIRGMKGGNAVECGGVLKKGCYEAADNGDVRGGLIIVPEGGDIDIIAHECVHHWLYMHTGDLDPKHESGLFLTCGGGYMLEGESD